MKKLMVILSIVSCFSLQCMRRGGDEDISVRQRRDEEKPRDPYHTINNPSMCEIDNRQNVIMDWNEYKDCCFASTAGCLALCYQVWRDKK